MASKIPYYNTFGLAIRLQRAGCTNRPLYKLVVMKQKRGPQKPYVEQIGSYDPMPNKYNERLFSINYDRLKYYMAQGFPISRAAAVFLGLSGFLPLHPYTKTLAEKNREVNAKKLAREAAASQELDEEDNS